MCSGFAPCDEEPAVVISQSMPPLKTLDAFAKPHIDEATKTKCGGILTVIALPLLMTGFSAWWWYDFYIFSETWRATTTESRLYANSIKDLKLECSAPGGCYFRLPPGGAATCDKDTFETHVESTDMCQASGGQSPAPANPATNNNGPAPNNGPNNGPAPNNGPNNGPAPNGPSNGPAPNNGPATPGRRLALEGSAGPTCAEVSCGDTLSSSEGVCAYIASDPIDALTIAWGSDSGTQVNFGAKLITDFKDPVDGVIKTKTINLHRGLILLTLVERHDPRMRWESGHAKSGSTVMHEWSVTPVDVIGTIGTSNICSSQISTQYGDDAEGNPSGWQVKLTPFPTFTVERTSYPSPIMTFCVAIGGIAGVFFAVLKVPAAGWLKMTETRAKKRCAFEAAEPQWRKGGADEVATSHSTQAPPEHV